MATGRNKAEISIKTRNDKHEITTKGKFTLDLEFVQEEEITEDKKNTGDTCKLTHIKAKFLNIKPHLQSVTAGCQVEPKLMVHGCFPVVTRASFGAFKWRSGRLTG